MDDTISRQAAIDGVKTLHEVALSSNVVIDMIKDLPSAQSEIIRCKDCKYSERWYRDKKRCFLWHETGIDVFEDGYCNYAERRADG